MRFVAAVPPMGAAAGTERSNAGSMVSVGAGGAATAGQCEGGRGSRGVAGEREALVGDAFFCITQKGCGLIG